MADTAPKVAPVAAATKTPTKESGEGKQKRGRPRNYDLGNGVYRFSRTRMYHKKAVYKFIGKKTEKKVRCIKPLWVILKCRPSLFDYRNQRWLRLSSPYFHFGWYSSELCGTSDFEVVLEHIYKRSGGSSSSRLVHFNNIVLLSAESSNKKQE